LSYNPSGKTSEFHYLCDVFLDGTTLHYADEDLSIQINAASGVFYEGRLPAGGSIVRSLGTFLEAKETVTTFEINLDNRDEAIQDILTTYAVANRAVDIWVGEGTHKDDYSKIFPGVIAHPAGISWDEKSASFNIIDKRLFSRTTLPPNRFTIDDFPNLELKSINQPKPIIYGNFASSQPGPVTVRAYCVDVEKQKFQIADHRIRSIDKVLKNAIRMTVAQTSNICLTDATFNLTGVNYDATLDLVAVNCQGIHTTNNSLIEKPLDVVKNIYTAYMGLTGSDLNGTAFQTANIETGSDAIRSVLASEVSTETLIGEVLREAAFDMRFNEGQYDPKARNLDFSQDRLNFREEDIVVSEGDGEFAKFSVTRDPDRIYLNKARAQYNYSNIDARYLSAYTHELTSAVASAQTVVERPLNYNWYYQETEVQTLVQREVALFSTEPQQVSMTLTARALLNNLADQIDLTYNIFDNRPMQIRHMDLDLAAMTVQVDAWDFMLSGVGRWTVDSHIPWPIAPESEKQSGGGYWTNSAGYAESGNDASVGVSKWY